MSNDLPIFPKAQSLAVHTGNIVNWNRLKNRLIQGQGPTEEVSMRVKAIECQAQAQGNSQYITCHVCCGTQTQAIARARLCRRPAMLWLGLARALWRGRGLELDGRPTPSRLVLDLV